MAKKPIVIENFQRGIGPSDLTGFGNMRCLDVSEEPGIAKVNGKLALDSASVMQEFAIAGTKFDGDYYIVDENDDIYRKESGTWASEATDFATGKVAVWKGYIIGARGTSLYALDNLGNKTTVDSTIPTATHQMCLLDSTNDKVYIIGGNNVSTLEEVSGQTFDPSNGATFTVTDSVIQLPDSTTAKCSTAWNSNIVIGGDDGYIYIWNRTDTILTDKVKTPENSVNQIININRRIYCQCGKYGNLYYYDGVRVQLIKKGPESVFKYGDTGEVFWPEAIAEINNKLLYGVTSGIAGFTGIYSYDLTTEAYVCEDQVSNGASTDVNIGVILPTSEKTYYVGWENGNTPAYGVDLKSANQYDGDEAYLLTEYMQPSQGEDRITFNMPELNFAEPLTANDTVKVYYREDLNASFTLHETISTVGTLRHVLKSLPPLKAIQLKVVLNDDAKLTNIILK